MLLALQLVQYIPLMYQLNSTHKEKVDELNLTKLGTKFVKKYPKIESFYVVPE